MQGLPPQLAFMSRKTERKRVATWSSGRRPKGQVPVVSMSMAQTLGMKISTARLRAGSLSCFGFQESSGMFSSWNRHFLTRGKAGDGQAVGLVHRETGESSWSKQVPRPRARDRRPEAPAEVREAA